MYPMLSPYLVAPPGPNKAPLRPCGSPIASHVEAPDRHAGAAAHPRKIHGEVLGTSRAVASAASTQDAHKVVPLQLQIGC